MFDPELFKQIVSETIPESLYSQLKPHLDGLSSRYANDEELKDRAAEVEYMFHQDRLSRFNEIRREFKEHNEPNWPGFARERWPEIDTHFNLKPEEESCSGRRTIYGSVDDDLPF